METTVVLLRLGQYIGAVLLFGVPLFFAFRMPMSDAAAERWPRTTLLVAAVAMAAYQPTFFGGVDVVGAERLGGSRRADQHH